MTCFATRLLQAALCGCSIATLQASLAVDAAEPRPSIAPFRSASSGETLPGPTAPTQETMVAAGPTEPPPQLPLSALSIDIRPVGEAPPNTAAADHYLAPPEMNPIERGWDDTLYFWQASNMAHRPLYFQQAYVERYGYNYGCLQPIVSGVQFLGDVPLLPVKALVRCPNECVYTVGYGRPGSTGVPVPRGAKVGSRACR
ncbi:MAG: hypothetical protein K8U03_10140 [Planctomycetia bacterium]|nr:hypothetical protein [Planctomycetia bacterium]